MCSPLWSWTLVLARRGSSPAARPSTTAAGYAGTPTGGYPTPHIEYLEIFHNRRRRHSSLGMLAPIEYELRTPTTLPAARNHASRLRETRRTSRSTANPVRFTGTRTAEAVGGELIGQLAGTAAEQPRV